MTAPLLTLVTRRATAALPLVDLASRAVEGGVDVVQVREPDLSPAELARVVKELTHAIGAARVAVNDAPGLAAELGIHLHLPERSLPGFVAREGLRSVSASVHAETDLAGLLPTVDYVLAGHLFPTDSHPAAPPLGREGLERIVAASRVPVVAIGGIGPDNVAEALNAGAAGVAVLSYVNSSREPDRAAREVRDAMERWMVEQADKVAVEVNGKPVELPPASTITTFLADRNLHPRLVVVERNREIVAKAAYDSTVLADGDVLEVAHFVGGG